MSFGKFVYQENEKFQPDGFLIYIFLLIVLQDCTFSSEDDTVCVMRNRLAVQGTRNSQVSLSSNQESDFRWDTQFLDAVASQVLAPVSH